MQTYFRGKLRAFLLITLISSVSFSSIAQGISVYQYRHVPNDNVEEFIKRETTYWKKVAEKATENGDLQFWALLQKMNGVDLQNSSNFLFIVTAKNIDAMDGLWDANKVFPDVPMENMETFSMSTVTTQLFVQSSDWQEAEGVNPENDFKYLHMIYHSAPDVGALLEAENTVWAPFIKTAMDKGQTTQKGWGNARIISPSGPDVKYNTISFDIYPSLQEALITTLDENLEYPDMTGFADLEDGPRSSVVYKIVSAVSAD